MKRTLYITLLATCIASGFAHAAGDPEAGKAKSAPCAACHGADGKSPNPEWPNLAGQNIPYLVKELRDFQAGKGRKNALMAPMVTALSPQDMEDIAAYFYSQPPSVGYADKKLLSLGEKIYRGGKPVEGMAACMSCHGPAGTGNPEGKIPAVAGQHAKYTANQLFAFRSGQRANDPYEIMRSVAKRMTDEEIQAVASYIEGLHRAEP